MSFIKSVIEGSLPIFYVILCIILGIYVGKNLPNLIEKKVEKPRITKFSIEPLSSIKGCYFYRAKNGDENFIFKICNSKKDNYESASYY